ncbi:MAG: hypothetical protein GEU86_11480 [Actinophytocola sp.]|nr:hypothetical protein [Actinophytocola sp.]
MNKTPQQAGTRLSDSVVGRSVPLIPAETRLPVACAVVTVLYSYLGALWLNRHGHSPALIVAMREWVNQPAGVGEDFGPLGIGMLLIVAGYAMTAAAWRRGLGIVAGLGWLIPTVWAAVTVSASLLLLGAEPLATATRTEVTGEGFLANLVLTGGVAETPAFVGLAWPVTTGLLFGAVLLATVSLLSRLPWLAVAVQLCALALGIGLTAAATAQHDAGEGPGSIGMISAFVAFPVLGELSWLARAGHLPAWLAGAFGLIGLGLIVLAEILYPALTPWWYPVTAIFAVLLTLLALTARRQIGDRPVVRWLASRALPILLTVGTVGYGLLGFLANAVPLLVAYPLALLATLLAAEALYRGVMRPIAGVIGRRATAGGAT